MVLSSLGPWSLAFLSARHLTESPWYHAALYFYLHCQYNGWFTLGLFALLYSLLEQKKVSLPAKLTSWHYRGYTITLLPSFILSLLWMKLSAVWTVIGVVSGLLQCVAVGAFFLLWFGKRRFSPLGLSGWPHIFLNFALATLFLKMLLELGSAIPILEPLVFATRNIVIGYLHLVLLGFVSFMLLTLLLQMNLLKVSGKSLQFAGLFAIAGFILNEAALFLDGLLDWTLSSGFPYRSMWLLVASLLMFIGIGIICYWQYSRHKQTS
ncbi:hypothetical protein ABE504_20560 [Paenibacillus oryzisoli]|uniref:hypothetical protein n=1 Tax=Paenibacillus oryzisoli TaxID=1850517 RepID=UPI003D2991F8